MKGAHVALELSWSTISTDSRIQTRQMHKNTPKYINTNRGTVRVFLNYTCSPLPEPIEIVLYTSV